MENLNSRVSLKQRNSSFELLRIIVMFFILLLHANFKTFEAPGDFSIVAVSRSLLEAISLVSVNIFILISGYFGIDFKVKKVFYLLFLCFFAVVPVSGVLYFMGYCSDYSLMGLLSSFDFIGAYWFILAYLVLLAFSPVLNQFVSTIVVNCAGGGKAVFIRSLIKYLLPIYLLVGLLGQMPHYIGIEAHGGYSAIWFLFLYIVGRYLYYGGVKLWSTKGMILVLAVCLCCEAFVLLVLGFRGANYNNPFILISSISIFLFFAKFHFYNKVVNTIASSAIMVYLINDHPVLSRLFHDQLISLYESNGMLMFCLLALGVIFCWYSVAIIYDQLRSLFWKMLSSFFYRGTCNKSGE